LNLQAFNINKLGGQQSLLAALKAKFWATANIMEAIAKASTKDQQALALRKACLHPSNVEVTKTVGLALSSTLEETHNVLLGQMKNTLKKVLGAGKRKCANID
jgi:hypothetical protein